MKQYKLVMAGLVGLMVSYTSASLSGTYNFSEGSISSYQVTEGGVTYDRIRMEGCDYTTGDIGAPELPAKVVSFLLPPDKKADGVRITFLDSLELSGSFNVYPLQPPRALSEPSPPFVEPNPWYYTTLYPLSPVEIIGEEQRGAFRIANVKIYPLRYDFHIRKLMLYTSISFEVEDEPYTGNTYCATPEDIEFIESIVENPEEAQQYSLCYEYFQNLTNYSPMIIITSDTLSSEFEELAFWRTRSGIPTKIFTTSGAEIQGSPGDDLQERIRNFIKDAYDNLETRYVLLGGDCNVVPVRKAGGGTGIACDLYYADIADDNVPDGSGNWDENDNGIFGELGYIYDLRAVQFVSIGGYSYGWIVGSDGLVARSWDEGNTWRDDTLSGNERKSLYDLSFVNLLTGWAVGANGKIFRTNDAGSTWVQDTILPELGSNDLRGVDFVSPAEGWTVGGKLHGSSPGYIFYHNTGGWVCRDTLNATLSDIDFVGSQHGWVISSYAPSGNRGRIFYSENGGQNWTLQDSINRPLRSVFALDTNHVWAVGDWTALRTENGGTNWDSVDLQGENYNLTDVCFTDTLHGWATGDGWYADDRKRYGIIIHTADGGASWDSLQVKPDDKKPPLYGIFFKDSQEGWAVGEKSIILHTTDGGANWEELNTKFFKGDLSCAEIAPDVWVGRAPVDDPVQASNFVNKVLNYENFPAYGDYAKKFLFLAGSQDENEDGTGCRSKEKFQNKDWYPEGFYKYALYGPQNGTFKGDTWEGDEEINDLRAIEEWNKGYQFINHMDHASWGCLGTGYMTDGGTMDITEADTGLHNGIRRLPIVWSYGCYANMFKEPDTIIAIDTIIGNDTLLDTIIKNDDAISECLINNPDGGVVAFIGNSIEGYEFQDVQDFQFFGSIFDEGHPLWDIGQAFSTTQRRVYNYPFRMNLLGDPSMEVWTDNPGMVTMAYQPLIIYAGEPSTVSFHCDLTTREECAGETTFVPTHNNPLQDVQICLYSNSFRDTISWMIHDTVWLYVIDSTNSSGDKSFMITPPGSGWIYVTATKHNYMPFKAVIIALYNQVPPPPPPPPEWPVGCILPNPWNSIYAPMSQYTMFTLEGDNIEDYPIGFVGENTVSPNSEFNPSDSQLPPEIDYYKFEYPLENINDKYYVRLGGDQWHEWIRQDKLGLIVADHPKWITIGTSENKEILAYSDSIPPIFAVDNYGQNQLDKVSLEDTLYFKGKNTHSLHIKFAPTNWQDKALLMSLKPYEPGDTVRTKSLEYHVVATLKNEGQWDSVGAGTGRLRGAKPLINLSSYSPDSLELKLFCIGDAKIDYVSLMKLESDVIDTTECYLETALYPDSTDVADELRSIDGNYADFHYGDRALLTYTAPSGPGPGIVRDFVVVSKGFYTPETTGGGPQTRITKPPLRFNLSVIQPNPARKLTAIKFQLPEKMNVSLKIYDASGKLVRSLLSKAQSLKPGIHTVEWDGKNEKGLEIPSGIYFVRLTSDKKTKTRKAILAR